MKYKPSRDIPKFVEKYKTFSPTELRKIVLNERNEKVTPESITNWFRRHSAIEAQLKAQVQSVELPQEEVSATIFENGTFEELPSVKNWTQEQTDRVISPNVINGRVSVLKEICKGQFPKIKFDAMQDEQLKWCYKHPDRLELDEVRNLIRRMNEKGFETHGIRLTSRNFLLSKGVTVGKKISGAKSKGFGKYANLYVPMDKLIALLNKVKSVNPEAYVIDLFMFKTGTRIEATLALDPEKIRWEERYIDLVDKGRWSMGRKPAKKYIDSELETELKQFIGDRKGHVFTLTERGISEINRQAMKEVIPEIEPKIDMPNHFWRHMFAQHMLRLTKWNYAAVAKMGSWTIQALQESYGAPPDEVVKQWGLEYMPLLQVGGN